jgi:beta-galactosidase/beta-glucuronidase
MVPHARPIAALIAALILVSALGGPTATGSAIPDPEQALPLTFAGPDGRAVLRGGWTVRRDPAARGADRGWQQGRFTGGRVSLPFSPNARQVTGAAGVRSFAGSVAWYERTVEVPRDGDYAIRFESVNHHATVWLDGRRLGDHVGTYLPFEDVVRMTAGRRHRLVVRADWRDPARLKREAWHRTWFNFGGINREVTLRPVGASTLAAPDVETRLVDSDAVVTVSAHVRNRAAQARTIGVRGALARGDRRIGLPFRPVRVAAGAERLVTARVRIEDPDLWQPGDPRLHDLELTVPGEAGYRARVGLRELRRSGDRVLLNGRRLELHGASIQEDAQLRGDALTGPDMDRLVAGLEAVGANATRSQHPLHPALLERLDAAGIVLWLGVGPVDAPGAWTSKTPALREQARHRVLDTVRQSQVHPSVIAWNLANEVAGNGHPDGQAAYIDTMARELHRVDPGRLVALDVWGAHPPRGALGPMYDHVDAIGFTNYVGWYERPLAPRPVVATLLQQRLALARRVFAGKVLVVTEFGAEANRRNATTAPGGFVFQSRLLALHIRTYRRLPGVSGMLVWNLRDFAVAPSFAGGSITSLVPAIKLVKGVNQKGLLEYDGHPKPGLAAVRHAFAGLGDGLGVRPTGP